MTIGEHMGVELVDAFDSAGFSATYWDSTAEPLDSLALTLAGTHINATGLQAFLSALRLMFEPARMLHGTAEQVATHYRTHVSESQTTKTFAYWCFHPGIALRVLRTQHRVRCVLLASGTLSPMDSFASELGSAFPIRQEVRSEARYNACAARADWLCRICT